MGLLYFTHLFDSIRKFTCRKHLAYVYRIRRILPVLLAIIAVIIWLAVAQKVVHRQRSAIRRQRLAINRQRLTTKLHKNTKPFGVLQIYQRLTSDAIASISSKFSSIDCDALFSNDDAENRSTQVREIAKEYSYQFTKARFIMSASSKDRCTFLKYAFGFNERPLSKEEEQFPLAYAALVYKWADQVFYMIGSLYHPQNVYCIAVDGKSDRSFKQSMKLLSTCFTNIHVMVVERVNYCGFSVINSVMQCLRMLTKSAIPWRYFQYISNFDLPLKTNHEMVRIFKRLNGSFNSEIKEYQRHRLQGKRSESIPYGVKLYKSSLSATFNRQSAEFIVNNEKAQTIFRFLNGTNCPDESLWTTIAGNPELGMPNGFDAQRWLRVLNRNRSKTTNETLPYYISRFQVWIRSNSKCRGKFSSTSCVYGVDDLPVLEKRPELIAHKFYLNYQPAAFFCLYARVRARAIKNIKKFDDSVYGKMAGPRVLRGEPIERIFNKSSK
ncbi:Beta-1,3-galactosyl-O-glycosyl-glycoprotein beta-1,6-N-acetylglucosaminyltransferase 3 [Toxocara canis]|uniref:Beta-1,3-galactosyl-O-glycosyl-glycoprotein beta-1,6-N-acetylglucosaminyltransferase 3 n=1 Tax=Toxocara canis TaxID=6265 RepID=A0A0B2VX86_TOXCA|nr:Beta-1,3-galactosyl-O-glycosyl-glycoprotein beta-1,6-N-acetylglucosaminyltransferase 3 [Toxocara canis]